MFEGDAEAAAKESKTCRDRLEKQERLSEEERKSSRSAMKLLTERLEALSVAKEQEASKRFDIAEQNKALRLTVDKLRSEVNSCSPGLTIAYFVSDRLCSAAT